MSSAAFTSTAATTISLVLRSRPGFRRAWWWRQCERGITLRARILRPRVEVNRKLDAVSAPAIGMPISVADVTIGIDREEDEVNPAEAADGPFSRKSADQPPASFPKVGTAGPVVGRSRVPLLVPSNSLPT